ncbi:MAG: Maf family protein [Caulobacterales bacterium]
MSAPIILASGSKVRATLMRAAGLDFVAISPPVDEEELKVGLRDQGLTSLQQAAALAEAKCLSVAKTNRGFVIGADQILAFEGAAMDKAADLKEARDRLWAMRGKEHQLQSGVVIAKDGEPIWRSTAIARLWMYDFSADYLDDYLARCGEAALSSVGCYQLENEGVRLFSRIEGDYFSILGLPLFEVLGALREHGAIAR